ncbi:MAG: DUF3135 domain-containing protein [Patescibacteria group bacterium]
MDTDSNDSGRATSYEFFEYWSNLAESDPTLFEEKRRIEIEKVILQAPMECRQSLRQLLWIVDGQRRKAKKAIDAMFRLKRLMWAQFYAKNGINSTSSYLINIDRCLDELKEDLVIKDPIILLIKKD